MWTKPDSPIGKNYITCMFYTTEQTALSEIFFVGILQLCVNNQKTI